MLFLRSGNEISFYTNVTPFINNFQFIPSFTVRGLPISNSDHIPTLYDSDVSPSYSARLLVNPALTLSVCTHIVPVSSTPNNFQLSANTLFSMLPFINTLSQLEARTSWPY